MAKRSLLDDAGMSSIRTKGGGGGSSMFADIDKGKADFLKQSSDGWIAYVQHYFVAGWIPPAKAARSYEVLKRDDGTYAGYVRLPAGTIEPGASASIDVPLYAGPQEQNRLTAVAPGFDRVVDFGLLTVIAEPLFWLLDKLHVLIGNWGFAIIALVVLLKAVFFPLNASAYRSMAKMKMLNPRIQTMRENLKDDPQKMQQEMLKIYREEKVNPIGGCLPILIQIPVFIALYSVLSSSVEIRNAPWMAWITDLSVKDPFYVLPALMTASTMLQTWLNPTPPDPVQAKMMWIMPLLFSVMFFFFPAGLVLYWLTNNILSIAQQYVINKKLGVAK